mmetsp:Transcript_10296/g.31029  ORF Transcript_10296/g.31029 Transcript_10296/m.31029 type:complete len:95 (-) Transcript_10296:190-474(-)
MEGRPEVGALTWYSPGISGLIAAGIIGFLVPSVQVLALVLASLFLLFLACLRRVEQSKWRKDLRLKQARRDKETGTKDAKAAAKAAKKDAKKGK